MEWPLIAAIDDSLAPQSLESALIPPPKYDLVGHNAPRPPPLLDDRRQQESQLIRDCIFILAGSEGDYIRFSETFDPLVFDDRIRGPDYRYPRSIEAGLRMITTRIAEMARHHYSIRTFIDYFASREHGRVNNALSASLRVLSNDFMVLIAKVESKLNQDDDLSLYKLWLHLHSFNSPLFDAYNVIQILRQESRAHRGLKVNDADYNDGARAQQNFNERAAGEDLVVHDDNEATIELRGGSVLRILADLLHANTGNPQARQLLKELLKAASKPYLEVLQCWIYDGELVDLFQEFLVQETKADPTVLHSEAAIDGYWEQRYAIRILESPRQLADPSIYRKLITAGKYLKVMENWNSKQKYVIPESERISDFEDIEDPNVIAAINVAYKLANQQLLKILRESCDLRNRLLSFNHYFLLDRGDFFPLFMDLAGKELLRTPSTELTRKLQVLLDVSLSQHGSISGQEPFADECQLFLAPTSLWYELLDIERQRGTDDVVQELSGEFTAMQAICLNFEIKFPLSIVLTRSAICRYQFLFRLIAEIKWTEKVLENAWIDQSKMAQWRNPTVIGGKRLSTFRKRCQALRARMGLFINHLLYHTTVSTIQAQWKIFDAKLKTADDVQQLIKSHREFLDQCLTSCYLTEPSTVQLQARLLLECRNFGRFISESGDSIAWVDPETLNPDDRADLEAVITPSGEPYEPEKLLDWLVLMLGKFESEFHLLLGNLVNNLAGDNNSSLLHTWLVSILNYNI